MSIPEAPAIVVGDTAEPSTVAFEPYDSRSKTLATIADPLSSHLLLAAMRDDAYSFALQHPYDTETGKEEPLNNDYEADLVAYWGITNMLLGTNESKRMAGQCHTQRHPYELGRMVAVTRHTGTSVLDAFIQYGDGLALETRTLIITEKGKLGLKTNHAAHWPPLHTTVGSSVSASDVFAPAVLNGDQDAIALAQKQWRDLIIQKGFDPSFVPEISRHDVEESERITKQQEFEKWKADLYAEEARIQGSLWLRLMRWAGAF